MAVLFLLFILVIAAGIIESKIHKANLKKIPWIIHVNGIRGKSSTTRLIHGGLSNAGYKTIAKTTGTEPRLIFEDGQEEKIYRAGIPRIIEQLKLINFIKDRNIDVLVVECMAISPEMQWISENKILQADIGVITNVKYDHQDKMGASLDEIASTLALTIPEKGDLVTGDKQFIQKFREIATARGSRTHFADKVEAEGLILKNYFKYPIFKENVAAALEVCRLFDISYEVSLKGMASASPDPGALRFYKLKINDYNLFFINGFAANDYESTVNTWENWQDWYNYEDYKDLPLIGIFNSRIDRGYRIKELNEVNTSINFAELYIMGYSPAHLLSQANGNYQKYKKLKFSDFQNVMEKLTSKYKSDLVLFGFGNTKNDGLRVIEHFRDHGEEL